MNTQQLKLGNKNLQNWLATNVAAWNELEKQQKLNWEIHALDRLEDDGLVEIHRYQSTTKNPVTFNLTDFNKAA